MSEKKQNNNIRSKPGRRLFIIILLLAIVNIASWFVYFQLDLTKDKRYTVTPATAAMLRQPGDKVEVLVFLEGDDLPAAFQSLANSTESMLRNFRSMSGNKVVYRFIDPLGSDTTAMGLLRKYGMSGIPVTVNAGKKGTVQKMIFPWALVLRHDSQSAYPVFLQEVNSSNLNRETLLKSEMLLEYNLANGIHQLRKNEVPMVAYLTGNGEVFDLSVFDAIASLRQYYRLDTLNLQQADSIPAHFKSIIINRPLYAFSETDKFKIDQYLMRGGNILWSINMATGTLDSLRSGSFNSMPADLNLNDLFYNYGIRINTNLITDAVNSVYIPLQASGNNPQPELRPWIYFPVLYAGSDHPVVKNLNGVLTRFVSSIDTNANDASIRKTLLLTSSRYSRTEAVPLPVILEKAIEIPDPAAFPSKNLVGAILLEGKFRSLYNGRQPQEVISFMNNAGSALVPSAEKTGKVVVLSDADILANDVSEKRGPSQMGAFVFTPDYLYDNRSFFLNCMEYITDPGNLLEARGKTYDLRRLDPKRVEDEKLKWQLINIVVPVCIILILGCIFNLARKRKYTT